jgi:hypothetical protein
MHLRDRSHAAGAPFGGRDGYSSGSISAAAHTYQVNEENCTSLEISKILCKILMTCHIALSEQTDAIKGKRVPPYEEC